MSLGQPDSETLERQLARLLADWNATADELVSLERRNNPYSSAFPSEIVVCRFADHSSQKLLLKYGVAGKHTGHGYWGNVGYEASVYEHVLERLALSTPRYFGCFVYEPAGQVCLAIQYLEGTTRLDKCSESALLRCAEWLGAYHAVAAVIGNLASVRKKLNQYDAAYFGGWVERTLVYSRVLRHQYPWIERLCESFMASVEMLTDDHLTIIHGEFYPNNILVGTEQIHPVDWQASAIARGEIDLASLTQGWRNTQLVEQCILAYQRARWPQGAPQDFENALEIARVYWPLRWLGDTPEWTLKPERRWYFDNLYQAAEAAGLL